MYIINSTMIGLVFLQRGARPNATFCAKLQNGASAQTCVWCGSTVEKTGNNTYTLTLHHR